MQIKTQTEVSGNRLVSHNQDLNEHGLDYFQSGRLIWGGGVIGFYLFDLEMVSHVVHAGVQFAT